MKLDVSVQFSQQHSLKRVSFLHRIFLPLWSQINPCFLLRQWGLTDCAVVLRLHLGGCCTLSWLCLALVGAESDSCISCFALQITCTVTEPVERGWAAVGSPTSSVWGMSTETNAMTIQPRHLQGAKSGKERGSSRSGLGVLEGKSP